MAAYIVVQVDVTDPQVFAEYRAMVPATLEPFNGRFLVRGGACETLEGEWSPKRLVVIEFPSMVEAQAWHDSEAYREPKALRQASAHTEMILVEGV